MTRPGDMNSEEFRVARNAIIAERVGHDEDCEAPSGDGPCAAATGGMTSSGSTRKATHVSSDWLAHRSNVIASADQAARAEPEPVDPVQALRDRIFVALSDEAPTWEEQFPAGPGHVVGVPDAATVAAKACYRWLLWRGIDLTRLGMRDDRGA